jgi:hypothetical protein
MKNKQPSWKTGFRTDSTAAPAETANVFAERHFTVDEIAEMWKLSKDSVRRLFQHEAGVLAISPRQPRGKRAYVTLRIPASVAGRVHKKLSIVTILTK